MAPKQEIQDKYKKLDHKEHVLSRPGMYIGSIEEDTYSAWVMDESTGKMAKRDINIVPGLYKIFDEILVNAIDHCTRLKTQEATVNNVKNIKITISRENGEISVFNDGDGIEIITHPIHNIYIPELIFGNMLTSTNYDDQEEKIIGGQNGIGAKACNIFSKSFKIETVDAVRKKYYSQTFTDNMSIKSTPTIKAYSKKPFTTITFTPDYERFKTAGLSDDMYSLFIKRCYDICALTESDVNIWLNGTKLDIKTFERYVDLYVGDKAEHPRFYEKINDRWEIVATYSNDIGFDQISFVNGIATLKGGKHVDYIANQITKKLADLVNKRKKSTNVTQQNIKNYLLVFVKSIITNPTFDSQSKDALTTPMTKFGSKAEVSDKLIEKLSKTAIIDYALNLSETIDAKAAKKTDGKKSARIRGLAKLDDANHAGTVKSKGCTLILTEGDSAKSMALAGLAEVGRDSYGVFPLRGKLLNVKDVAIKKLTENEEIQNIKKIMGLESGKVYNNVGDLRYGRIMIMSDQDHDGSHIRGLIMNLFHTCWPSLLNQPGFMTSLLTPIIKVTHNTTKVVKSFYNMVDYEEWLQSTNGGHGFKIKYYKGLGTSDRREAIEYFRNMHLVKYDYDKEGDKSLDLAFNKKRADDRKTWMSNYDPKSMNTKAEITYSDFVNKELVHFSVYDVKRSIPSVIDGFKPSQRKIMFSCFKRNLVDEIKVAQLSGYVSEHSGYHHGDVSLQGAIVGMAQDFVGSNNINLLMPNGMFGSRRMGGKDAGQARYIYTQLAKNTVDIFKKDDSKILDYLNDDGFEIEPEYYVPVMPMILVNGACGIGTGFSTNVPCYNPRDVINALIDLIDTKGAGTDKVLVPWYKGFNGRIQNAGQYSFTSHGLFTIKNDKIAEITELPIGVWTQDYKEFLEEFMEKNPKVLKDYESQYTDTIVRFVLHFYPGELDKYKGAPDDFERDFKLVHKNINTSNMHLFDTKGVIKKYDTINDILVEFYQTRMAFYHKRKASVLEQLEKEIRNISNRAKFILGVIDTSIPVMGTPKAKLEAKLEAMKFDKDNGTFGYLVNMPIYNLTAEKRDELLKEKADLNAKFNTYKGTAIEDIWKRELGVVLSMLDKDPTNNNVKKQAVKIKRITRVKEEEVEAVEEEEVEEEEVNEDDIELEVETVKALSSVKVVKVVKR